MAEELLGINKSSLDAIGRAIRDKGGTNALLSFPSGMVSALQAITTEATVTPKITAQQKTLTPNNTYFPIDAGFHDGTGTVSIQLDTSSNSANPTSSQQTYYPGSGKFFGSFTVGGTGAGYKVMTGTVTPSSRTTSMSIPGLGDITPIGMFLMLNNSGGNPSVKTCVSHIHLPTNNPGRDGLAMTSTNLAYTQGSYAASSFSYGSVSLSGQNDILYFEGTYWYMVWGN